VVFGGPLFFAGADHAMMPGRRPGSRRNTTSSERQSFIGREQARAAFIEKRGDQLPTQPNFINVDNGFRLPPGSRVAPAEFAIPIAAFSTRR
jgi:hypothetical protein